MRISNYAANVLTNDKSFNNTQNTKVNSLPKQSVMKDATSEGEGRGVTVRISEESQALFKDSRKTSEKVEQDVSKQQENLPETETVVVTPTVEEESHSEQTMKTLRSIMQAYQNLYNRSNILKTSDLVKKVNYGTIMDSASGLSITMNGNIGRFHFAKGAAVLDLRNTQANDEGTVWVRGTKAPDAVTKEERMTLSTVGIAHTSEGKTKSFGIELEVPKQVAKALFADTDIDAVVTEPIEVYLSAQQSEVSNQHFTMQMPEEEKKDVAGKQKEERSVLAQDKGMENQTKTLSDENKGTEEDYTKSNLVYFQNANTAYRVQNAYAKTTAAKKTRLFTQTNESGMLQHVNLVI